MLCFPPHDRFSPVPFRSSVILRSHSCTGSSQPLRPLLYILRPHPPRSCAFDPELAPKPGQSSLSQNPFPLSARDISTSRGGKKVLQNSPMTDDPLSGCSKLMILSGMGNNIPFCASGPFECPASMLFARGVSKAKRWERFWRVWYCDGVESCWSLGSVREMLHSTTSKLCLLVKLSFGNPHMHHALALSSIASDRRERETARELR